MTAPRSDALLAPLDLFGIRLGLERTRRILAGLGEPQHDFPAVLIAGTNGKGSTAAFLSSICRAAGYRTGLYTSPHLECVTERLQVDGEPIDDGRLARHLREVLATAARGPGNDPPTYFEALTIAAFLHFREAAVDLAILEVGLGGRLDATNVSEPIMSLITSISRDHQQHLGTTLAEITREKCGILRRGRPAIAWTAEPEVERTLRAEAQRAGSDLILARDRVKLLEATSGDTRLLMLETGQRRYALELGLAGRHQYPNAALAVLAAETLAAHGWSQLGPAAILDGCRRCRWPGRLETVDLPGGGKVLLDCAHNPDAIAALAEHLATVAEPYDLLFGAMRDKAIGEMLPVIAASARRVVLSRVRGPRAADPHVMEALIPGKEIRVEPDLEQAVDHALGAGPQTLVVCGSVALAGEVRRLLRQRWGVPAGT